eukprot:GDKH01028131.1.p2 GENE.GDKH01028131.1~~GDKH01028131.1.p2  ORF type:complete len:68 (-),score=0.27 GDKH01028131.1:244-447(-)
MFIKLLAEAINEGASTFRRASSNDASVNMPDPPTPVHADCTHPVFRMRQRLKVSVRPRVTPLREEPR